MYSSPSYGALPRRTPSAAAAGRQIMSHAGAQQFQAPPQQQQQQQEQEQEQPTQQYAPASSSFHPPPEEKYLSPSDLDQEQADVEAALAMHRCICDICTCGRHHCPAKLHLQAHYEPDMASVYRETYPRHITNVQRAKPPPSIVFSSGERFEGESAFKADFKPWEGARPAPLLRPPPRTTVGDDSDTRDFKSESAANYKTLAFAKRQPAIPAHTMHVTNEPFLGQSTSKEDFPRWSAKPAEMVKPQTNAAPTGADDRDFVTESGSKFNAKGYVARQPAIPFTSHVFENEPFQGESSMKDAYKQWDIKPSQSFKPKFDPNNALPEDREVRKKKKQ
jgi:hypothetical protein